MSRAGVCCEGGWRRRERDRRAAHPARAVGVPPVGPRGHVPLVRDVNQDPRQELQRIHRVGACGGALLLVGAVGHRLRGPVICQPLQGDGIPRTGPCEPGGERAIVLGNPQPSVHVEPGVRPRQHPGGLVRVNEIQPH